MKNNRQKQREATDEIREGLELLFGSESDLSDDELEAELNELGVKTILLDQKTQKHLRDLANHHFISLGRDVPPEMNKALLEFRSPTIEQQPETVVRTAESRIKSILASAKSTAEGVIESLAASVEVSPQYAFRNRTDLSESDLEILESGQTEVNRTSSNKPQGRA